jgi:cytochrome c biogenesis protein CcdA
MCGIAMLIFGIIAFVKGEFKLTRNRVVRRGPAYAIGALLVLPFPLSFCIGLVYGAMLGARHEKLDVVQLQTKLAPIEVGLDIVCLLAALTIAVVAAKPVRAPRPAPVEDEYEDQYQEDEPRTKRRDRDDYDRS